MSYDNATSAAANYMHQSRGLSGPVETPPSGLSASAAATLERLERVLAAVRRVNNRIHGPEPKAAQGMPPDESDPPLARTLERAHRLLNEIDAEMSSIESRL